MLNVMGYLILLVRYTQEEHHGLSLIEWLETLEGFDAEKIEEMLLEIDKIKKEDLERMYKELLEIEQIRANNAVLREKNKELTKIIEILKGKGNDEGGDLGIDF